MMAAPLTHILMVDDDPDIQAVARLALVVLGGFSVVTCSSGSAAIATVATLVPDLILLDVTMPEMDGPSTLKALRAIPQTGATPAIFITARVQAHEIARYAALGVLDVIVKPFDPMTLSATIRSIWERKGH